jgi:hypothetical protein
MANQTVTDKEITVHGRGSLVLPWVARDANKAQIDVSNWIVYFEVDGVPIREQLVKNPADPLGLILKLERVQVATLSKLPTRFAFIDETYATEGLPRVLWEGVISRTGYVGDPDATNDA